MTMDDRQVHAVTLDGRQIVRYDRASKWYVETSWPYSRRQIDLREAVRLARTPGATVVLGASGGRRFDAAVIADD